MALRKLNPNIGATIELVGSIIGVLVILFLIVTWVPRNYRMLLETGPSVYLASIGIGLTGMLLGYWLARGLRQDTNRARTISLETGIQNGPLAALVVTLTFTGIQQQEVLFIPILYSLFIVITSSPLRRRSKMSRNARVLCRR